MAAADRDAPMDNVSSHSTFLPSFSLSFVSTLLLSFSYFFIQTLLSSLLLLFRVICFWSIYSAGMAACRCSHIHVRCACAYTSIDI